MDPYRDANAPPPYDGPIAPYCPPAHAEKFSPQPPMNPDSNTYQQGPPSYSPHGPGYAPQQGQQGQGYSPQQYAPHAQSYAPLPQAPQIINITQPAPVVRAISVGQEPIRIDCPGCHQHIKSKVLRNNTMKTHLIALLLCLLCCWPCIVVPYCMSSCKDTTHTCPKCKTYLGTYRA